MSQLLLFCLHRDVSYASSDFVVRTRVVVATRQQDRRYSLRSEIFRDRRLDEFLACGCTSTRSLSAEQGAERGFRGC